jgi:tetratricopeptide (TPR) repeat protein
MLHDVRGLAVSTSDRSALDLYEAAAQQMLSYSTAALATVEAALERDPGFVMGHCLKAALVVSATEATLEPMLATAVVAGERNAARATDRERMHLSAARAWLERDFARSIDQYGRIAVEYPRDAVAIQTAHLGHFYLGMTTMLRDHVAQVLHAWDEALPGYAYVLGMYAFGLEENGEHGRAERTGRRAVELEPADAWSSHAVAHVLEMNARIGEGIRWLEEGSRHWASDNGFVFHNHWHLALYHLDRGDAEAALAVYDRRIRPSRSPAVLELIDASALLWRMFLLGHDVGRRVRELADDWRSHLGEGYYVFNDAHAMMALAAAGRDEDVRALLGAVEAAAAARGTNGQVIREVGLRICRAIAAFGAGDHGTCIEELVPVRHLAVRFGGSNAQRDALSLTLLEAALRSGRTQLARALASERVHSRPASPPAWALSARALEAAGDAGQASRARRQAERLRQAARGSEQRTERAAPGLHGSTECADRLLDDREVARGPHHRQRVEDLVVSEDGREGIGAAEGVHRRTHGVERSARHEEQEGPGVHRGPDGRQDR